MLTLLDSSASGESRWRGESGAEFTLFPLEGRLVCRWRGPGGRNAEFTLPRYLVAPATTLAALGAGEGPDARQMAAEVMAAAAVYAAGKKLS